MSVILVPVVEFTTSPTIKMWYQTIRVITTKYYFFTWFAWNEFFSKFHKNELQLSNLTVFNQFRFGTSIYNEWNACIGFLKLLPLRKQEVFNSNALCLSLGIKAVIQSVLARMVHEKCSIKSVTEYFQFARA